MCVLGRDYRDLRRSRSVDDAGDLGQRFFFAGGVLGHVLGHIPSGGRGPISPKMRKLIGPQLAGGGMVCMSWI